MTLKDFGAFLKSFGGTLKLLGATLKDFGATLKAFGLTLKHLGAALKSLEQLHSRLLSRWTIPSSSGRSPRDQAAMDDRDGLLHQGSASGVQLLEGLAIDDRYRYYVAIYRCDGVTSGSLKVVCGDVKVEIFREDRTYVPSEYLPAVVAAVKDAEYCFPAQPQITLDSKVQHLGLTTRTSRDRRAGEPDCAAALDRVIALFSAISSPDLFRTLVFRGWLQGGPPSSDPGALMKPVPPITLDPRTPAMPIRAHPRASRVRRTYRTASL